MYGKGERKEGRVRDQGNIDRVILQQVLQIDSEWPTHETHVPTTANSIYVTQTYAPNVANFWRPILCTHNIILICL